MFKKLLNKLLGNNGTHKRALPKLEPGSIIHWVYADNMAAKEGYGIVLDNSIGGSLYHSWKRNTPVFGWMTWKDSDYPGPNGEIARFSRIRLSDPDWVKSWCVVEHPTKEILEQIRYAVYVQNKHKFFDNLSTIEILDRLKQYERTI